MFLSVCVVPLPRIPADERYVVTKVRSVEGMAFFLRLQHTILKHFPGFYGVTYYIGFRDDFDVRVGIHIFISTIMPFWSEIVFRLRIWLKRFVSLKDNWILEFRKRFLKKLEGSPKRLHICGSSVFSNPWNISHPIFSPSTPHYHVVSKHVNVGFMSPFVNYLRAFLIEGIYRRLGGIFSSILVDFCFVLNSLFTATMFPETANWLTPADEYVLYSYLQTCFPKTNYVA